MNNQKKVFVIILLSFSIALSILPYIVTFNDFLTKVVEKNLLYGLIQQYIVPIEAKMIGVLLLPFGYKFTYSPLNSLILVNGLMMEITWNCIGWQSFLLFFVTLTVGFNGRYSKLSIAEALILGVLGTFWLNILRMLLTVLLAVYAQPIFRIVYHDYLAAITTIIWLFFFWWFAYSYVLVEKRVLTEKAELAKG